MPFGPFKDRLRWYRDQRGMSRAVLGGLVGRSDEWVKGLESGRLLMPRLPLLLQLAEALQIEDLADLTGDERLTTASFGKAVHDQLPEIAQALASYPVIADETPADVAGLTDRVRQTWNLWHGTRRHRTAIASLLPGLLRDSRVAVRRTQGDDRRSALAAEAQIYHLTQLYLSFQPAAEYLWVTGDRAMTAAQDADDPHAMAAAAWYLNHIFRDAGQAAEARVQLASDTATILSPERSVEDRALYGLMHLAIALSHAKVGREGDAWRAWDEADRAAKALPAGWSHPWLKFGRGIVDGYAIDILNDLVKPTEATRLADQLDLNAIKSATRRSRHIIQIARAYHIQREPIATVHLLRRAEAEAPETVQYDPFTRSTLIDLAENGGAVVRDDARDLARSLGILS